MAVHVRGLAEAILKDGRAVPVVAYHAGIDEFALWNFVLCRHRGPSRYVVEALSRVLGVPVEELIAPGPKARGYSALSKAEQAALEYGRGNAPAEALTARTNRR